MKIVFTFLFMSIVFHIIGQATFNPNNNTKYSMLVSGKVIDYESKLPLDSVMVKVSYFDGKISDSAYSDINGNYQLKISLQIVVGNYPVKMTKKGYNTISGFMYLKDGLTHNHAMSKRVEQIQEDTTFITNTFRDIPKLNNKQDSLPLSVKEIIQRSPKNNFVFLVDVSGSMADEGKMDILKSAIRYLVQQYRDDDQVAIIIYSSVAKVILPTTYASEKKEINTAIDAIQTGGKTDGGKGLDLAYNMAKNHYLPNGNNKVVLATDGIFGADSKQIKKMNKLILEGKNNNIKLSILSFGKPQDKIDKDLKNMAELGKGLHVHIQGLKQAEQALINLAKE